MCSVVCLTVKLTVQQLDQSESNFLLKKKSFKVFVYVDIPVINSEQVTTPVFKHGNSCAETGRWHTQCLRILSWAMYLDYFIYNFPLGQAFLGENAVNLCILHVLTPLKGGYDTAIFYNKSYFADKQTANYFRWVNPWQFFLRNFEINFLIIMVTSCVTA